MSLCVDVEKHAAGGLRIARRTIRGATTIRLPVHTGAKRVAMKHTIPFQDIPEPPDFVPRRALRTWKHVFRSFLSLGCPIEEARDLASVGYAPLDWVPNTPWYDENIR